MTIANRMTDVEKQEVLPEKGVERASSRRVYSPRTDVLETQDAIEILADIPGADEKNVDITLEKGILTIHASPEIKAPENYRFLYGEYGMGDFHRAFSVTDQIDQEHIGAVVKDGVLRLTLPKAGPAKARKIQITAG